jgi:hypothetical protein
MKAKEKAKQLVNSFYYALPNNGSSTGLNSTTARYKEATVCALIAVDEIIEANPYKWVPFMNQYTETVLTSNIPYWQEVKLEIENIGGDK